MITKVKGIFKAESWEAGYKFPAFLNKHGLAVHEGYYKISMATKVKKRRKLKKVVVHYYDQNTCGPECCGSHMVVEIMMPHQIAKLQAA